MAILRAALLLSAATLAAAFSGPATPRTMGAAQRRVSGPPLRRAQLQRRAAARAPGLRMQWENREPERLPFQKQWENFKSYNMGRWRSRALHLNPETGEYMEPFLTEMTVDVMPMEEGVQSAKQLVSIGGKNSTVPQMSESVVTVNDELECSDDGTYSLDRSLFSLPDVAGTFRFCIEFSLALSSEERVRCLALYDFESKLSRIVLYEERRVSSTGAQRLIGIKLDDEPEPAARSPLTLLSCLGEFRGDAVGRRAARLGGGNLRFGSRSDMQWSQDKLRREMQVLDQRNRIMRKTSYGPIVSPAESVVTMENGHRLLMLPSSCYVCLPTKLETSPASASATLDAPQSPAPDAPTEAPQTVEEGTAAVKRALEAAFKTEGVQENDGELMGVESFSAEFGCFVADGKEVMRTVRIYTEDGKMASSTTMAEKRVGEAKGRNGLSYDSFS